jgi:hypothetical protein
MRPTGAASIDSAGHWTARAIHDTVAAIARQPAYSTSLRETLLGRFFRFLWDRFRDLRDFLGGVPGGRPIVIFAVALVVFVIVARIVVARRIEDGRFRASARRGGRGGQTDFWVSARELSQAGDHAAACHALYVAVLSELTRAGAIRLHPSKTSGDYARELARRGAPSAAAFRAFARQFEHLVFGAGSVSASDFDRLASAAEQATPRAAAA